MSRFTVLAEETIAQCPDPNNGAGPLWSFGSKTLVRDGNTVWASVMDVGAGVKPLCNTRWRLFRRPDGGCWELFHEAPRYEEREPCPLACLPGGRVVISTNPKTKCRGKLDKTDDRETWHTDPCVLTIDAAKPAGTPPEVLKPVWDSPYAFFEHSYRGLAVDRDAGAIWVSHQVSDGDTYSQAWSFRDTAGEWSHNGILRFPIRGCYPMLAVRGRAAHVVALGDIEESNPRWRECKKRVTGSAWDYDFRQLFYRWTPDLGSREFSMPLTFATRDETAGSLVQIDMALDPDGDAHILYFDCNFRQPCIRDEFFPGTPLSNAVKYCRISKGAVTDRRVLFEAVEDLSADAARKEQAKGLPFCSASPLLPIHGGGFHVSPSGRLRAVALAHAARAEGGFEVGTYVFDIFPALSLTPVRLGLKRPLGGMPITAGIRTGATPSDRLDLLGWDGKTGDITYAQVETAD
ncbi:MAG: hypothetical protein HY343_12130 [Lentisphaerae bacterium]|nr:hypothetical protein [Lentisphaerota bacterium]